MRIHRNLSSAPVFAQRDTETSTAVSAAKLAKAQRRQTRKEARAKRNAELKKLEDAGYQPGRPCDPNYPQDPQNAEKKAVLDRVRGIKR
ncbi:hypothetical protein CA601_29465 [Paraburkholderia hospita]|nr:DUF4148 domain-containing protein [Paraburkholderia hospita]OUL82241.1 hypothetical protein CA601_29465 [Paraburkholderia hospita]